MKVFYDTEFLEDGRTIYLISMGMVAEDGRELYLVDEAITKGKLYDRITEHNWLMDNVIPHLPLALDYEGSPRITPAGASNVYPRKRGMFRLDDADNRVVSRRFLRNAVRSFLQTTPDLELWAWYGAYDHVVLAQLFGRMIDLPPGVPMWTNDLQQELARLGNPEVPGQEGTSHNALDDARHVAAIFKALNLGGAS